MSYSFTEKKRIRKSFASRPSVLEVPSLLDTQLRSYEEFLQADVAPNKRNTEYGLQAAFTSIFPITSHNGYARLRFVDYELAEPEFDVAECQLRGLTFCSRLRAKIQLEIFDRDAAKPETLKEEVFYQIRQSDPAKATEELKAVAEFMKRNPEAKVSITGYADKGTGNARINKKYSQERANKFKDELVKNYGINASRIITDAKGDTVQPFADNDKNRCVIIIGPVK